MPEVQDLFKTRTVEVSDTFNDEPFKMTICVYPSPQTPHFGSLARRAQEGKGDDADDAYAEMLSILIPKWDLEMDGEPFLPTKDNFLQAVPRAFADHVFQRAWKAVDDAQPKATYIEDTKEESKTADAK